MLRFKLRTQMLVPEREFIIDNLLVHIHYIIVMISWTGLAPWEFESIFPGSLTSTFLAVPETFAWRVLQPPHPRAGTLNTKLSPYTLNDRLQGGTGRAVPLRGPPDARHGSCGQPPPKRDYGLPTRVGRSNDDTARVPHC